MRRVFTLSFWKKAIAFCFVLVIVSVMLSGFQQPAEAAVPANCGVYVANKDNAVTFRVSSNSVAADSSDLDDFDPNLPRAGTIYRISNGNVSGGRYYWLDGVGGNAGINKGDIVVDRCSGVTVVSTYAEGVWARYGEALIFLAGLITGVAIFWLLVGKVLKVLRLRRP